MSSGDEAPGRPGRREDRKRQAIDQREGDGRDEEAVEGEPHARRQEAEGIEDGADEHDEERRHGDVHDDDQRRGEDLAAFARGLRVRQAVGDRGAGSGAPSQTSAGAENRNEDQSKRSVSDVGARIDEVEPVGKEPSGAGEHVGQLPDNVLPQARAEQARAVLEEAAGEVEVAALGDRLQQLLGAGRDEVGLPGDAVETGEECVLLVALRGDGLALGAGCRRLGLPA